MMVGGTQEAYERIAPILLAAAAKYKGEPCCALVGPDGAGHFVKTIHNGIEYADMQMIAEIYGILRDGLGLSAPAIGDVFGKWNQGPLNSYLIEITAKVLKTTDPDSGKAMVDMILDEAGQKGTGRWAAIEAQMLGVPATAIEAAVAARSLSSMKAVRALGAAAYKPAARTLDIPDHTRFLADLEQGLLAGKIAAYAQGFAVMEAASLEHGWNIPLAETARIWRAGCIIRSQLLDDIAHAFDGSESRNLLLAPAFVERMGKAVQGFARSWPRPRLSGCRFRLWGRHSAISIASPSRSAPPISFRASAISSARTVSSALTGTVISTAPGADIFRSLTACKWRLSVIRCSRT